MWDLRVEGLDRSFCQEEERACLKTSQEERGRWDLRQRMEVIEEWLMEIESRTYRKAQLWTGN